ncbi:MAG TPA: PAS-domain containing protein [Burkholderiaceae bacterium]|nr:PAS-domain containing protein [Burkholderiaceae bacterium]
MEGSQVHSFALWGSATGTLAWPLAAVVGGVVVAGIVAIVLLLRAKRRAERALAIGKMVVAQIEAQHDALRSAIDGMPDGLAVFDADDRLIACNRSFAEAFARTSDMRVHGARHVDLVRAMIDANEPALAPAARERLVAKIVDWHRQGGRPWLQRLSDGRWLRVREKRLPDGGSISICSDATEFVRLKHEAQAAEGGRNGVAAV